MVKRINTVVFYITSLQYTKKFNILGNWINPHSSRTQSHRYQYPPSQQEIYEHSNNSTSRWFAIEVKSNMFTINKASKQKNMTIPFDTFLIMKVKH